MFADPSDILDADEERYLDSDLLVPPQRVTEVLDLVGDEDEATPEDQNRREPGEWSCSQLNRGDGDSGIQPLDVLPLSMLPKNFTLKIIELLQDSVAITTTKSNPYPIETNSLVSLTQNQNPTNPPRSQPHWHPPSPYLLLSLYYTLLSPNPPRPLSFRNEETQK